MKAGRRLIANTRRKIISKLRREEENKKMRRWNKFGRKTKVNYIKKKNFHRKAMSPVSW